MRIYPTKISSNKIIQMVFLTRCFLLLFESVVGPAKLLMTSLLEGTMDFKQKGIRDQNNRRLWSSVARILIENR